MFIWCLRLTVASIVLLALIVDISGFLRFAPAVGLPRWAAIACMIPIKGIEWTFLILAHRLWVTSWLGKLLSPIPVVLWFAAFALSSVAVHSVIYSMLASADHSAAQKSETRANLKVTLAGVDAQIASLSKPAVPRPLKTVQEELGWFALPLSLRRATDHCRRIVLDEHRKACKEMLSLRKELATSGDYEHLRRSAEVLRTQLAALPIEAAQDQMPRSFELIYGGVAKIDGKEGIALTVMLLLTLVPALGPFCLDIVSRGHGDTLEDAAPRGQAPTAAPPAPAQERSAGQPLGGGRAHGQTRGDPPALATGLPRCAQEPSQQEPAQRNQSRACAQAEACPPIPDSGLPEPVAGPARPLHRVSAQRESACPPKSCPPPVGVTVEQACAGARTATRKGAKRQHFGPPHAHDAIQAFAARLDWGPGMRATGSEVYEAYMAMKVFYGWPDLPSNNFGRYFRYTVEQRGGSKRKSSSQIYEGVSVPALLRAQVAAAAATNHMSSN
jgi:hypothetical protein